MQDALFRKVQPMSGAVELVTHLVWRWDSGREFWLIRIASSASTSEEFPSLLPPALTTMASSPRPWVVHGELRAPIADQAQLLCSPTFRTFLSDSPSTASSQRTRPRCLREEASRVPM